MQIIIPGIPIPKARHRSVIRAGHIATYDPKGREASTIKRLLASYKLPYDPNTPAAYAIDITFDLPIPPKKGPELWHYHTKKPDTDNLAKFILDCANGILWTDDSQITSLTIKKNYSQNPKTVLCIEQHTKNQMLDADAEKILAIFSPNRLATMLADFEALRQLLHENNRHHHPVHAAPAAALISRLADIYGKDLSTITKKYPGYWKKEQPE